MRSSVPKNILGRAPQAALLRTLAVRQPRRFPGHAAPRFRHVARQWSDEWRGPDQRSGLHRTSCSTSCQGQPRRVRPPPFSPFPDQHRDARAQLADSDGISPMKPAPDIAMPLDHRLAHGLVRRDQTTDGVVPYRSASSRRSRDPRRSCARTTAFRKTARRSRKSAAFSAYTSAWRARPSGLDAKAGLVAPRGPSTSHRNRHPARTAAGIAALSRPERSLPDGSRKLFLSLDGVPVEIRGARIKA